MEAMDLIDQRLLRPSTPRSPVWNQEYRRLGKENKWNYMDGCMIRAFLLLYRATGDRRLLQFCTDFVDAFVMPDGSISTYHPEEQNLDHINAARNLLTLFSITGTPSYQRAAEQVYQAQILTQPRNSDGSFWHKRIYPSQVWLDGLYMALPFCLEYALLHHDAAAAKDVIRQFQNAKRHMCDPVTGLYYHGYDESRKACWANPQTGLSSCFWLRAIGWLAAALADCCEILLRLGGEGLDVLTDQLCALLSALLPYQQKSGMFCQIPDQPTLPGNYEETSGTALIAYAMCKSAGLRLTPPQIRQAGLAAYNGIVLHKCNRDASELRDICLVAGLGGEQQRDGSLSYYLNEPITKNDAKGIAPLLMTFSELCGHNFR